MDKLRTKDARYYRNLLYKNEFRVNSIHRDVKTVQQTQLRYSNCIKDKMDVYEFKQTQVMRMLYIVFIMQCVIILQTEEYHKSKGFKDMMSYVWYHDYTRAMLHMWKDYWKQVSDVFRSFEIW